LKERRQRTLGGGFVQERSPDVDARDLVTLGHVGHLREHEMRIGNVDQLVVVLEIEMVVRRDVGVEIGLGAVDADLAQQARIGELIERVVDSGQRHRNLGERGFLVEHFRGQMAGALAEQQPAQRHALAGRPQPCGLQHFVDVVPGTAGQRRLMSGAGGRIDTVVVRGRGLVVHVHFGHHALTLAIILSNIKGNQVDASFSQLGTPLE